jgi:hypothetical protein
MTITVLPIIEPGTIPAAPLSKVMNARLRQFAAELQNVHLQKLESAEPLFEDLVIYISYDGKYNVRWRIVNDVKPEIEKTVAESCAKLGYIYWKTATINTFKGR